MGRVTNENAEQTNGKRAVYFEIPVITTSSPSAPSDSDSSPVYVNVLKRTFDISFQSDEEDDTSFITNNNSPNGRNSILRTLSPANLNSSGTSRGVNFQIFIHAY